MDQTALHTLPDYIVTLNLLARAAVPLSLLGVVWLAIRRSDLTARQGAKTGAAISATLLGWFAVAWLLSQRNVFSVGVNELPRIELPLLIPIVAGLALMLRTESGRAVVAATPQSWLVGLQVYRALGFMFLVLWAQGKLPGEFALPAGIGDIIVGVTAPFVAWLNARNAPSAAAVTRLWNIFGIADLVVAVTTGFLTSPSPLQMLAFDRPNLLITEYPIVMVPAFLVPVSIILHGLSLWKLPPLACSARSDASRAHA
jgi:hypothetical protein